MRKYFLLFIHLLFISFFCLGQERLKTPSEFLGFELGDRFVRHHQMLKYYEHVASTMPNVALKQYGETYEYRPLVMAVLTSPENFSKLETIREDNLKRIGLMPGKPSGEKVAIVWLSYNVHGNESSSMDASMKTLYALANPDDKKIQEWLEHTVVIMDPCINPDGRERYVNFYYQYGNKLLNPNGASREHHEPWPNGRANHYLFDLNRDWAWLSQIETQQRIAVYNQWMPHIHVDYHEQFHNAPYYFAPAAEPFHEIITPWQREFQTVIGKNHARYFDQNNWLYFTKESFDLFYPSYGDTYPTYNGAIGMTYEQAGHGYAGLAVYTEEGDTLTLKDRILHHYTTGLSTVEITSQNSERIVDEFEKYYRESSSKPAGKYKSYVIKMNGGLGKVKALTKLLDKHQVAYGLSKSTKVLKGFDYKNNKQNSFSLTKQDLVINAYQPKSNLLTALFEPKAKLSDSVTYDITAWSLPYAYGLEVYAVEEGIATRDLEWEKVENNIASKPYAYISEYACVDDVRWLSKLVQKGIKVRFAEKAFTLSNKRYAPGSIVITRRDNETWGEGFDSFITNTANEMDKKVYGTNTGFVSSGPDFGSQHVHYLKPPKVAILSGQGTSSLSFGEVWYFFEQEISYPADIIGTDYFGGVALEEYDVLVLPEGNYNILNKDLLKKMHTWIGNGGKLIVIGSALSHFVDQEGFILKHYITDQEKEAAIKKNESITLGETLQRYENRYKNNITSTISGAIYNVKLDNSHPLAFGYDDTYFSLKKGNSRYAYLKEGWNVGVILGNDSKYSGFSGYKTKEKMANTLVFGVEEIGNGEVVYMVDNPLYRAFWENGKLLFGNAIFMVGN